MQVDLQQLKAIRNGNERAIYVLYQACYRRLYLVCRRYSDNADEVGDLLNRAFLKMVKHIESYRTEMPFEAWMTRIAVNTAIDEHRRNKHYRALFHYPEHEHVVEHHAAPDGNYGEYALDAEDLLAMIRKLPLVTRTVFNMFAMDGYAHKDIAEQLGISEGTTKWHVANARKKLQEMLEQTQAGRRKKVPTVISSK